MTLDLISCISILVHVLRNEHHRNEENQMHPNIALCSFKTVKGLKQTHFNFIYSCYKNKYFIKSGFWGFGANATNKAVVSNPNRARRKRLKSDALRPLVTLSPRLIRTSTPIEHIEISASYGLIYEPRTNR